MAWVVAVAGPVGAGKTTLVRGLARRLPGATTLHFDHFQQVTEHAIETIASWMRAGADPNAFRIPGLAESLAALARGRPAQDPATGATIPPGRIVLFDTPFGTLHADTAQHVDLLIWIETPLDVALARKLREFTGHFLETRRPEKFREFVPWLHGYLGSYLDVVADLMRLQKDKVGGSADVVIDGLGGIEAMVEAAAREIEERLA
jgi:uridine kinase